MADASFEKLTRPVCRMCPRDCGVDRGGGERGYCEAGPLPHIAQAGPHHGEEPPLSGRYGSGTLFLTGCNLHCLFCQNYDISSEPSGRELDAEGLAQTALSLEAMGCHNINFVTPTHHADVIADSIRIARKNGLEVPIVYNCGGYELPEALHLLGGLVEIYMPDMKFIDTRASERYLNAPDYGVRAKEALKIMQGQVGDLEMENGLAKRGLLVRHLVMPGYTEDALAIMDFLHDEVSPRAYVNVMGQYWPTPGTGNCLEIQRGISMSELQTVRQRALELGLRVCR